MSEKTAIDVYELRRMDKLNSKCGTGKKVEKAMDEYRDFMACTVRDCFGPADESTTHGVVDELYYQMESISSLAEEVNLLIDNMLETLQTCIIDRENSLVETIRESE